ncbi:type III pantothenate kinase [Marilutibacter spongiae]|uniref:Type III pantothenate kinase n=1 Tax=Marilutibacter spongiae TaxID=2025720 RepID=A0A7W3TIX7_9GAMM|nr:type III pantothenate kinase [Lysobacter spongiae]MBB1058959.1 type III pantothenate kinase [Lysobacter spongiae]
MNAVPTRWLFDLGNTRLKCAPLHADGSVGEAVALDHHGAEVDLATAMARALPARIEVAYLASVASADTTVDVLDALSARCRRISRARTQAVFDGVAIAYARPQKLGVDRFLALLAAHARGGAALVCGVGTALTLDLVDADGRHHGGRIAPSPTLMRESLHGRARQLAPQGGAYAVFATDTEDALASGCDGAALALVEHSLAEARRRLGEAPRLYLHGGGADDLVARLPGALPAPGLVLEGLARWAEVEAERPGPPVS